MKKLLIIFLALASCTAEDIQTKLQSEAAIWLEGNYNGAHTGKSLTATPETVFIELQGLPVPFADNYYFDNSELTALTSEAAEFQKENIIFTVKKVNENTVNLTVNYSNQPYNMGYYVK